MFLRSPYSDLYCSSILVSFSKFLWVCLETLGDSFHLFYEHFFLKCSHCLQKYYSSPYSFLLIKKNCREFVILISCSISYKIKNFQETGVASLASVRVLFCFHGEEMKDTKIQSQEWGLLYFPPDLFAFSSLSSSFLIWILITANVSLWGPGRELQLLSFENS